MTKKHKKDEPHYFFEDVPDKQPAIPVSPQLVVLSIIILGIFGTGFMPHMLAALRGEETQSVVIPLTVKEEKPKIEKPIENIRKPIEGFTDISLQSTSAFVWDVQNQRVLYEKEADKQLPLASIAKLMTALVAHEIVANDTSIPISSAAISQYGNSGLSTGERFALGKLTDLTLMSSSNDGAFAIAAAAGALLDDEEPAATFVEAMNIRAKELDLTQTYFRNPTGLDVSDTEAGAYGSARDVAFLMQYILANNPEILERTTQTSESVLNENGEYHLTNNTNYVVDDIPGLIGSKTGYTFLAGGNLAVAFNASLNHPVVIVVLNSTKAGRFKDVLTLSKTARNAIQ